MEESTSINIGGINDEIPMSTISSPQISSKNDDTKIDVFKSTFENKMDFTFHDINHHVTIKEKGKGRKKITMDKQILHNVNGLVKAGEMMAIMGPSGAGKTTLLDILAHRICINGTGEMMLNGTPATYKIFKRNIGYVTQHDTLSPSMTVRETLSFYAQLKMQRDIPLQEKLIKVEEIIGEMGLKRCANTLVGNDKIRGISGGERRRVTIAIELLTGPSILFLDEPTSGLDASTSLSVIKAIRRLANSGRTIICTIHQPRSNIFDLFDKLLLLAEGSTIYYGFTSSAVTYFNQLGYECKDTVNPADFFMDLINTQIEDENDDSPPTFTYDDGSEDKKKRRLTTEEVARLKRYYVQSKQNQYLVNTLEEIKKSSAGNELSYHKHKKANGLTQFKLLLHRELLNLKRNPMSNRVQIMSSIMNGLLCGLVFYQLGVGQSTIQSRTGVLAFIIMGIGFPFVMLTIQVFPEIITIFMKDRASGVYTTLPFFIAKSTIDCVIAVICPIIMGTIVYWMSNERVYPFYAAAPFFKFLLVLVMASQISLSMGVLISSAVPSVAVGTSVGPPFVIFFFLFSGFFINLSDVPSGWIWAPYISYFKYVIEAAVVNEFENVTFTCTASQQIGGVCPTQTGQQLIDHMNYDVNSYWRNIWICVLFIIGFRAMTYGVLSFKSRPIKFTKSVTKNH
ncbi:hypothetical protein SAMD00019534_029260 [Acytostelium subglobosum LB1]|uniref:hypothetical protein n=1 Tax=Acytostelium subglobosum LB1 TaxID=1410327 RepID=UPI000644B84A|nr:hypothetical protein SAMD00019534_029260 [Acytostelium subglobosum LB1]GAM19751.1 hypothetical protein SAMD00019534_029260 [Acytostelium subglobosum LB1]|eukprot:XP_012756513.1 hypothetical protein SAMD00019534_029260 [Acytostelium subglobosum LB1]